MLNIIHALGMTLLHFLWQGALVGIALWLLLFIIKRPQQRYLLACLSLLLLSLLPVITYLQQPMQGVASDSVEVAPPVAGVIASTALQNDANVGQPAPVALSNNAVESSTIALETPRATWRIWRTFNHGRLEPFLPYIVLAWLLGVLAFSLRLLAGYFWLHHMRARALTSVPPALATTLASLKEGLSIPFTVQLRHSDKVIVPMVMGIFKPIILLPSSSLMGLSMSQLETILAHELAHIQRHDYLVNMLQSICEALLFYHPVMWWVNRVIRHERELCCDDIAVRLTNQPKTYAHALSLLAHNSIQTKTTMAAQQLAPSATGGSMYQRIQRILQLSKTRQHSRPALTGLISLALLGAVIFTLVVTAQENRARDEASSPLWITVVGDITLQDDSLIFDDSHSAKPFIVVEERTGQQRSFDSRDDDSKEGEYTLALAELEPWLAQVLRDVFPKVLELQENDSSHYLGTIASQEVRLMVLADRTKSEDMLSLQPAVRSYEEIFAELDLNEAQYASLISTSFHAMAQRRQHGLLVDQEVMMYLRTVAKRHSPLPFEAQESLDLLISTMDSEVLREEARALFTFQEQALHSESIASKEIIATPLWLTFVGKFSFQEDGIVIHHSQEKPAFFVIEERAEAKRKYVSNQEYARAGDYFLAYETLEPWLQTILQDFQYVLPRMQAGTNAEYPYRASIDREHETPRAHYEHVNIIMYSEPDGVANTFTMLNRLDIDLSLVSTYLLVRRDMAGVIQQRTHDVVSDAEVVAYLQNVQKNHPEVPQQLQGDFEALVGVLDEELQADILRGFNFVDRPLHNDNEAIPLLFATFAGDVSFSGDGVTLRASAEQPSFLILEEVNGRKRRYEKRITFAETDEAMVRVRDVPRWAQEAFLEIIVGMPMNPTESYGTGNPSNYLDYQYWIKYVDSADAIPAPYRDRWTESHITERSLLGASRDIYTVLQYSMHGLLEDATVLQYLYDTKEKNAEALTYFPTEVALLIASIEDEGMREAARALFSENEQSETEATTLWLAFAGDIRSDDTGFTLVSSADMPSFFHLDELDNDKRSIGSMIDYSQSLETTFNFDDFEPWAADILRETVTSLEMTDEGMPIYSALLSYESGKINFIDARTTVMPLEGVTEEVINNGFVMNDWGITYYLYQLQENDASRLIALEPYIKPLVGAIQNEESRIFTEAMYNITDDSIQADEIWFTVVGDVHFDRDTIILSPSAEHEAFFVVEERGGQGRSFRADSGAVIRRLVMRELEPWVREILTFDRFVVNFIMEDADTINLYRTVQHEEPVRPPTRFVIVKDMNALEPLETETLTRISSVPAGLRDDIIESLTEAIQRKKHGVLSDGDAFTYLANLQEAADISTVAPEQLEEFLNNFDDDIKQEEARAMLANYTLSSPYRDSLTLYEQRHDENFSATAIDALTTVLNYREQGRMPDAMLVQYLRDVQLGNPILPNEAKPLLDNLIAGLASTSQEEAELFSYADMNTPPQWFVWNPKNKPHLWLTIAGDFVIEDDSITFYSSPEQPSFLIVEEVTGQRRRYSPSIAYDQARETRIALNDMDAWAADAIENLLLILPERPSKHYANLDPHNDTQSAVYIRHNIVQEPIRYANTILLTENTDDRVTAGQEAELEDFIRTLTAEPRDEEHARLITLLTWREMQRAIQRKAHGLLNDELAMGYLRALHEQGEALWQQHTAEITALISFIEDDALRSEAQELF